jgi:hypothetical protein
VFNGEPGRPTGNVVTGRKGALFLDIEARRRAGLAWCVALAQREPCIRQRNEVASNCRSKSISLDVVSGFVLLFNSCSMRGP